MHKHTDGRNVTVTNEITHREINEYKLLIENFDRKRSSEGAKVIIVI